MQWLPARLSDSLMVRNASAPLALSVYVSNHLANRLTLLVRSSFGNAELV